MRTYKLRKRWPVQREFGKRLDGVFVGWMLDGRRSIVRRMLKNGLARELVIQGVVVDGNVAPGDNVRLIDLETHVVMKRVVAVQPPLPAAADAAEAATFAAANVIWSMLLGARTSPRRHVVSGHRRRVSYGPGRKKTRRVYVSGFQRGSR